jgi:hypothetical protein
METESFVSHLKLAAWCEVCFQPPYTIFQLAKLLHVTSTRCVSSCHECSVTQNIVGLKEEYISYLLYNDEFHWFAEAT